MQYLLKFFFKISVWLAAIIYQAEGINLPLRIMPTRFIAPILQQYGAQIGSYVRFNAPLTIHNAALKPKLFYGNLTVGDNCYFGRELLLDLQDKIIIRNNVTISHRIMLITHADTGGSPLKDTVLPVTQAPITINQGAYLGAGAIILPGIKIGECAIVGAGAVVTKDVPASTVVAGVPAQIIKKISK